MFRLRRLAPEEEADGYRSLVDSVAWQQSRSLRLWEAPLPREIYARRQARGENFGLFEVDDVSGTRNLVAVLSLLSRIPDVWRRYTPSLEAPWLATLAVAQHAHGRRIGRRAVDAACAFLRGNGETVVYLDCALGYLESFYFEQGFRPLARGELCGAAGACSLPAVLMMRDLAAPSSAAP